MPMGMEHRLEPRLEQRLRLSPRIIQSIEILQLPLLALEERVEQELVENPVLELAEERPEAEGEEPDEEARAVEAEEAPGDLADSGAEGSAELDEIVPEEQSEFERVEELVSDWEDFYSQTRSFTSSEDVDAKQEALQNTAGRPASFDEYLLFQLRLVDLTPEVRELAERIIYSLDKNGYLTTSLEELFLPLAPPEADEEGCPSTSSGQPERVHARTKLLSQAEEALSVIQSLDPAGVGARDLRECLLLQITEELPWAELVRELVSHHLEALLENRLPAVAEATGRSIECIYQALKSLALLNPRPGMAFSYDLVPNVVPDLTARYEEVRRPLGGARDGEHVEPQAGDGPSGPSAGRYRIVLNESGVPALYIRKEYRDLLRQRGTDPKLREFVKNKIRSAQWLMDAIEQRRRTLTRVAQAIVDHQQEFMELGEGHLRPLRMQEVADEVGVHVATVSRAVAGKYLDTPHGIYELRSFFTGGTITAEGTEESWENVKGLIVQLAARENKSKPLSDQGLADRLAAQGYSVARRTVTKYRKELGIPSARLRRQYHTSTGSGRPEP